MKTAHGVALTALLLATTAIAQAEEVVLTDNELDAVTAGDAGSGVNVHLGGTASVTDTVDSWLATYLALQASGEGVAGVVSTQSAAAGEPQADVHASTFANILRGLGSVETERSRTNEAGLTSESSLTSVTASPDASTPSPRRPSGASRVQSLVARATTEGATSIANASGTEAAVSVFNAVRVLNAGAIESRRSASSSSSINSGR